MLAELIKGELINNSVNIEKTSFIQKLRSLKSTDPKSYWSLLNKAKAGSSLGPGCGSRCHKNSSRAISKFLLNFFFFFFFFFFA